MRFRDFINNFISALFLIDAFISIQEKLAQPLFVTLFVFLALLNLFFAFFLLLEKYKYDKEDYKNNG